MSPRAKKQQQDPASQCPCSSRHLQSLPTEPPPQLPCVRARCALISAKRRSISSRRRLSSSSKPSEPERRSLCWLRSDKELLEEANSSSASSVRKAPERLAGMLEASAEERAEKPGRNGMGWRELDRATGRKGRLMQWGSHLRVQPPRQAGLVPPAASGVSATRLWVARFCGWPKAVTAPALAPAPWRRCWAGPRASVPPWEEI